MFEVNVNPTLIHLGPLAVSWYGLALLAAVATGIWLTTREARRKGLAPGAVGEIAPWVVGGGLVGARLLHVIDRWEVYADHPMRILAIQQGGLAIQGAILGGAIAGGLAAWRAGLPVRRFFDVAAPGLILAQAIGRLGCLVTGDAVGRPTDAPWGIVYRNPGAMAPELGVAYQPVFLFEQIWDLGVFAALWFVRRRLKVDGQLFALYLGLYAAGKFGLTYLRTETVWFWGLQEAQMLALVGLAASALWAIWSMAAVSRPQQTESTA